MFPLSALTGFLPARKSILAAAILVAISGCDSSDDDNDDIDAGNGVVVADDGTGGSGDGGTEDSDSGEDDTDGDAGGISTGDSSGATDDGTGATDNNTGDTDDGTGDTDDGTGDTDDGTGDTDDGTDDGTDDNGQDPDDVTDDQPEGDVDTPPVDTDGDGVSDDDEAALGLNPENPDTDADGVEDGADAFPNDPIAFADTDGDGVDDSRDEFPEDPTETTDLNGDGLGDNANPVDGAILNGTVSDATNMSAIAGATVNLDLISFDASFDAVNRVTTDANGVYQVIVNTDLLPDSFIITASNPGFRPDVILADSDDFDDDTSQSIDIALIPISDDEVVIEEIPVVHHLGDDSFGGTANSQFQRSTEGVSYIRNFTLSTEQISSSQLSLLTAAKGVQRRNEIFINSVLVGTFPDTNSDGSYTMLEIPLAIDPDVLINGSNSIEIRSVATATENDIDDFEFVNISITGFTQ